MARDTFVRSRVAPCQKEEKKQRWNESFATVWRPNMERRSTTRCTDGAGDIQEETKATDYDYRTRQRFNAFSRQYQGYVSLNSSRSLKDMNRS